MAECCVGATGAEPGRGLRVERIDGAAFRDEGRVVPSDTVDAVPIVSVGSAFRGTTLTVRDESGNALPDGFVGEVWVSGESVMAGYLDDPESTDEVLRGGELRTGDLGCLLDGELFVAGRRKHVLIVRGRNYYSEAVEAVVEDVSGVRKGNAVAFGVYDDRRGSDALHLAVETRLSDAPTREALQEAVSRAVCEEIGLTPVRVWLLPPNTIPKTSSGKKRRLKCKEMLLAGGAPGRLDKAKAEVAGVVSLLHGRLAFAEMKARQALRRAG